MNWLTKGSFKKFLPVGLITITVGTAAATYGGVAVWAQTVVGLLACLSGAVVIRQKSRRGADEWPRPVKIALGSLLIWILMQAMLLRTGILPPPGCDQAVLLQSRLFLWGAYTVLAWGTARICRSRRVLKAMAFSLVFMATAIAAIGVVALYTNLGIYSQLVGGGRAVGTFSSGNSFGGFLAISLPLTLGVALGYTVDAVKHIRKRGKRLLHMTTSADYQLLIVLGLLAAVIIQAVALILSGSRGAMLSAFVAVSILFLWFVIKRGRTDGLRYTLPVLAALVIFVGLLGIGGTYGIASGRLAGLADSYKVALPRLEIWCQALRLIAAHPLGVGPGCFSVAFEHFQPLGFNINHVYHAHNDYLELLAELGIPGMLLLLSALAFLLSALTKRLLRTQGDSISLLIRFGCLLALVAGLLHALADFNLSSRPGVAVLYFVVLGMAVSQRGERSSTKRVGGTSRGNRLYILIIALAVFLSILQIRLGVVSVLMRRGFCGVGGNPSIYFMLPTPEMHSERALAILEKAVAIMPRYSETWFMLARARLMAFERVQKETVKQSSVAGGSVSEATIRRQVEFMLAPQEQKTLVAAGNDLQSADSLAPGSVGIKAYQTLVYGRLAYVSADSDTARGWGLRVLDSARVIQQHAANNFAANYVAFLGLSKACQANAISQNSKLAMDLKTFAYKLGVSLLQLNLYATNRVVAEFGRMGLSPIEILKAEAIPVPVIWKIYAYYAKRNDARNALQTLDALEQALDGDAVLRRFLSDALMQRMRSDYRQRAVRAKSRWYLRSGRFGNYCRLAAVRSDALARYITDQLHKRGASSHKDLWRRYQVLGKIFQVRGLPQPFAAEYYELATQFNASELRRKAAMGMRLCTGNAVPECFAGDESFRLSYRIKLVHVRQALQQQNYAVAEELLNTLMQDDQDDPDVAAELLRNGASLGMGTELRDRALARLRALNPRHYIGMQFLGGRMEFAGISAEPDLVQTFWRFRSTVPADLQVVLQIRNRQNKAVYSRGINFIKVYPVKFGNGAPQLGRVYRIDFRLPASVGSGSRMLVGLRSRSLGNRYFVSEAGLPYFECYDWMQHLLPDRHLLRDQIRPNRNVRLAFQLENVLPREHFSHNLQNIFDAPQFYPLLDGSRHKTEPSTWQPCLSASGLVARAANAAKAHFDANPASQMFSLGINDGQDWCECDACCNLCSPDQRSYAASQRWWSEPYWRFVNQVAAEVAHKCPGKRIGAIAYSNVVRPPSFNLQSNVTVYVCLDAGSHFDERERSRDRQLLQDWCRVCSDVGLYDYAGLVSWLFPRYCRDDIADDIKTASELGVKHFYIEDIWVGGLGGPLPWITRRLVENPALNAKKLQTKYCKYAYGPAAETMDLYFDYLQEVWRSPEHGHWFDGLFRIDQQVLRYPPAVRRRIAQYLADARDLAQGNPAVTKRINAASAPLRLAETFAVENDIMQQLKRPIESLEDLQQAETLLAELDRAINFRRKMIDALPGLPWGASALRALRSSQIKTTISRWNHLQTALVSDVRHQIMLIRNALRGVDYLQ